MRASPATGPAAPPPPSGPGRVAVFISLGLHVAGFLLAVGVPRLLASAPRSGPVYVVDLVTLPGPPTRTEGPPAPPSPAPAPARPAPAPAKPPPAPKKTVEKVITLPDKGAKKTPPKPKPRAAPPEKESPSKSAPEEKPGRATPESATAQSPAPTSAAQTGVAGAAGAGAGKPGEAAGGGASEYEFYIALLDRSIRGAWTRPVDTSKDVRKAIVSLQLSRTGRVMHLDLASPSGFEPLDRSVLRAVRDAEPFPPFPLALSLDTLTVRIEFELTPEGQGSESQGN